MDKFGINVIGHVGANLGVGVATRQVIALIESLGHEVAAFDVDRGTRRERAETRYDRITRASADELPHDINLFVLGLGAVDWALRKCPDRFFDGSRLNALVCFWELPVLSPARAAHLDQLDVVIGPSDFLRHVFAQSLTRATVLPCSLPVSLPEPLPFDRDRVGIPSAAVVFCFSFDPASDPTRKNPHAVIAAFIAGVGGDASAWLLLRINNATGGDGDPHPVVAELRAAAAGHPRIVFAIEPMSYREVLGLYRACDVYVSLHRAEGLGLGMAEAMVLGLPVIATGWSGNMSFMDQTTACLVDYRLVPVRGASAAYVERGSLQDARWADADVQHAAALMRHLLVHPETRQAVGAAAAVAMKDFNDRAHRARFVAELGAIHDVRKDLAAAGTGYARPSRGRPELRLPPVPLVVRVSEAAKTVARRAVRKLAKIGNAGTDRAGLRQ